MNTIDPVILNQHNADALSLLIKILDKEKNISEKDKKWKEQALINLGVYQEVNSETEQQEK